MQAVHFENKTVSFVEVPVPVPGPGQALLKVRMAGICNTDIELIQGYYGFTGTPGHEFTADVAQAPDAPEMVGKRVCADINCGCGHCRACLCADSRHCPDRTTIGIVNHPGAFAEYLLAPVANLRTIPGSLTDEQAVFAEPLAAALEIGQQIHLAANMRAAVLGDGKLGLLAALALAPQLPNLVLVGKHPDKLKLAQNAGVATRLVSGPDDYPALGRDLGPLDLVVEATGSDQGLNLALPLLRPEGTLVAKTTSHKPSTFDLAALVVNEYTIVGSRCGDIGLALRHLATGRLDPTPLIEAAYPFADFPQAFTHARQPGAKKVLVRM